MRALQRDTRSTLTDFGEVVRDEVGLLEGSRQLDDLDNRQSGISGRPDVAGFSGFAHTFDLRASHLAARATLACAVERRESRGAHDRSDYCPDMDTALQVNLA